MSLTETAVSMMTVSALSVPLSAPSPAPLPLSKVEEDRVPLKFCRHHPLRLQVDVVMDFSEDANLR